ncbi:gastrula zinc finger protein XlCGF17.1-like isoform X2 [Pseudoliparis swirei]|uniref:gastrula zinc finger protein XlCGF17.1-like isoform X2 n=1 Tax=Pseudoliparis swirei TaxID=2059687 RepID=UPI0024BDDCBB|nr:gastrula zinc finger protein XlCGF17.1-like isoform X2 [Pseudoliparis swirei]XP_056264465.1 gastrula zinc finger protein XlCGF17.1-like isoform X2 [Pseudoliparis swirei]
MTAALRSSLKDGGCISGPGPTDVQQLLEVQEEVPLEQQDWSTSLEQDEPDPPHIKEEQEELWTNQEGAQLQGLAEAGIRFSFSPVKSEDDEEESQSSHRHQRLTEHMETEADEEECGGPEPDRKSDTDKKLGDSTEPDDWKETREPQSGLNSLSYEEVHVSDPKWSSSEKLLSCSECGKRFYLERHLKEHMRIHTEEKTFSCSFCDKIFKRKSSLKLHMMVHTGEKPFSCSECDTRFKRKSSLKVHMMTHTGEKPFSCSECGESFKAKSSLKSHMRSHTVIKPFSCLVCNKSFKHSGSVQRHMVTHTGEKPFSCSICKASFALRVTLQRHSLTRIREKPLRCSVCDEIFLCNGQRKLHMASHTAENSL